MLLTLASQSAPYERCAKLFPTSASRHAALSRTPAVSINSPRGMQVCKMFTSFIHSFMRWRKALDTTIVESLCRAVQLFATSRGHESVGSVKSPILAACAILFHQDRSGHINGFGLSAKLVSDATPCSKGPSLDPLLAGSSASEPLTPKNNNF